MRKIAVGDLVVFYSNFDSFQRGYEEKNPGVILSLTQGGWQGNQVTAEVLWSDGTLTNEHAAYLNLA